MADIITACVCVVCDHKELKEHLPHEKHKLCIIIVPGKRVLILAP